MEYQDPRHSSLFPAVLVLVLLGMVWLVMARSDEQHAETLPFTRYPAAVVKPGPVREMGGDPTWTFETEDSPEQVLAFYRENAGDWTVEESSTVGLVLARGEQRLVLAATAAGPKTMLVYTLKEP